MLESFFLSERKLLKAILRVKLKYHERCFILMRGINNAIIFNVEDNVSWVRAFCRASRVRAS